eukprot:GHVT01005102.1.p1 GENE.GHVT01005102.1~~GHVT01005102.1.p1  ORF type:complete len:102 (-),score=8.29 GHVT01005102.1:239-544(-)
MPKHECRRWINSYAPLGVIKHFPQSKSTLAVEREGSAMQKHSAPFSSPSSESPIIIEVQLFSVSEAAIGKLASTIRTGEGRRRTPATEEEEPVLVAFRKGA